jgi:hypothetical protein
MAEIETGQTKKGAAEGIERTNRSFDIYDEIQERRATYWRGRGGVQGIMAEIETVQTKKGAAEGIERTNRSGRYPAKL